MNPDPSSADPANAEPERRRRVLDAALETFWRFGFRKTSMDEVAQAADISRQGLYFYFGNKEDLFREAMRKSLEDALNSASARLAEPGVPIQERLIGAMDEWSGRYIGVKTADASDLAEKSSALLGSMFNDYGSTFQARMTETIASSTLAATLAALDLEPVDVVRTLHACGVGWKHMPITRAEFVRRMSIVVKLICR